MDDKLIPDENPTPSDDEQKSGISADLIRGHINTIILRTLYERDKYGYEIIEEIEAKSHGQYSLKQPTLYSALKRLESQGYVNAYWKTDEVSQGGRRKYYTLTDSGREVAEKNQAEWEYSRTVIDNLISDRNFDFSQPAPTAVDFKILKQSTSRVPLVKNGDEDEDFGREVKFEGETEINPLQNSQVLPEQEKPVSAQNGEAFIEENRANYTVLERESEAPAQPAYVQQAQPEKSQPAVPEQSAQREQVPQMTEEQRRIRHENYLRLISQPAEVPYETPPTPYSENFDTNKIIYNNKSEAERDYRNLVNNLFVKTVQVQPAPAVPPASQKRREQTTPAVRYEDANLKADKDGLTVNTSEYATSGSRRKKYNRGATLLKCSLIIAAIMLLEFALLLIFKNELAVGLAYPFVILALACAQILIFGVLYANDRGKITRKPATLTYLSSAVIVAIILIMIICVVSLLLNVNFASTADILAKIVIPSLVALNIPVFAVLFYVFSK